MPPGQRRGPESPTRRPSWSRRSPLTTRTVPGGRAAAASSGRGSPPMMSVAGLGVHAGRSALGRHEQVPEVRRDGDAAVAAHGQRARRARPRGAPPAGAPRTIPSCRRWRLATPPAMTAATPMARARDIASMSRRAPTTRMAPAALTSMREAGISASGAWTAMTMRPTAGRPQPTCASTARPSHADVDATGHHGLDEAGRRGVHEDVATARRQAGDAVAAVLAEPRAVRGRRRLAAEAPGGRHGHVVEEVTRSQADDGGRRRDLDGLLLAEALDDGLPGLDALPRDDERPIREMEREAQHAVAVGRPDGADEARRLGSRRRPGRSPLAARPDRLLPASRSARRCSPPSGSSRGIGRVSMSRPPRPPLTSRRDALALHAEDGALAGVDLEPGDDARRQVDEPQLSGLQGELLLAEQRRDGHPAGLLPVRARGARQQGAPDGQQAVVHEVGQEPPTVAPPTGSAPSGARTRAWSCRIVEAPGRRMPSATASADAGGGQVREAATREDDDVGCRRPRRVRPGRAPPSGAAGARAPRAGPPAGGAPRRGRAATRDGAPGRGGGRSAWPGRRAGSTSAGCCPRPRRPRGACGGSSAASATMAWRISPSAAASVRDPTEAPTSMPSTRPSSRTASDAIDVRSAVWPSRPVAAAPADEVGADLEGGVAQGGSGGRARRHRGPGRAKSRSSAMASGRSMKGPQAMTARSSRRRASEPARGQSSAGVVTLVLLGCLAAAHDDRIEARIEAGLPEGDEVRARRRRSAPSTCQPARAKARSRSQARLRPRRPRGRRAAAATCAPRGAASRASPASSRPRRHRPARHARRGPRAAPRLDRPPARRSAASIR